MKGKIFDIQRFSIHDGPGARTVVFFKGCNLACQWCHNPESIDINNQVSFNPDPCIGCWTCFEKCPYNVHRLVDDGEHQMVAKDCCGCYTCIDECFSGALTSVGKEMTIDEVMTAIKTDMTYYDNSQGGVTFSGGECMLQVDYLESLLKACKEVNIHTAVDTAGHVPWSSFERIMPYTDLFLYDIKASDSIIHKALTGVGNERIIENLQKLSNADADIIVRVPLIPGANEGEMEGIAAILEPLNIQKVEVLPYHKLGEGKHKIFDSLNNMKSFEIPDKKMIDRAKVQLKIKD